MTVPALLTHLLFLAALTLLSALIVRGMIAVGPIDMPDRRKAHARPVPKGGGVGVVLAFLVGIAVLYGFASFSRLADGYFRGLILASAAIALVAFLDDLRDWPFTVKLAAQVGAGLLAVGSGLYVTEVRLPWWGPVALGWAGAPLTLAWILFVTNAVNFMDGLNGLVSGVCLIAALALAAAGWWFQGWFVYFAAALLAAGLAGFLPFNFPRARIFLGDVGSQFCGFVLAVLTVAAGRFQGVDLSVMLVPALLFGVLFDVAFTLVRRHLAGDRVTEGHRGHLYQLAHRSGLPAVRVTLVQWGFAAWGALCCAGFLAASGGWKPLPLLLVLPPQIAWAAWVLARARRRLLEKW